MESACSLKTCEDGGWLLESFSVNCCENTFTGKELDDSGLYYFGARYYDPVLGTWLSPDPAMEGVNWYSYCGNNPMRYVDPWGLSWEDYPDCEQTRMKNMLGSGDDTDPPNPSGGRSNQPGETPPPGSMEGAHNGIGDAISYSPPPPNTPGYQTGEPPTQNDEEGNDESGRFKRMDEERQNADRDKRNNDKWSLGEIVGGALEGLENDLDDVWKGPVGTLGGPIGFYFVLGNEFYQNTVGLINTVETIADPQPLINYIIENPGKFVGRFTYEVAKYAAIVLTVRAQLRNRISSRGSTGRTQPHNLNEKLAMDQVKADPLKNATNLSETKGLKMSDQRWSAEKGWAKYSKNVNGVEIHFNYNKNTGEFDDFKFAGQ
jgi:RHS repeat-associated protein